MNRLDLAFTMSIRGRSIASLGGNKFFNIPRQVTKWKWKSLSCVRLCDTMDYTVHGILQARILERVTVPVSRGFSQARDRTQVSLIAGRFFTSWATREALVRWAMWRQQGEEGDVGNWDHLRRSWHDQILSGEDDFFKYRWMLGVLKTNSLGLPSGDRVACCGYWKCSLAQSGWRLQWGIHMLIHEAVHFTVC